MIPQCLLQYGDLFLNQLTNFTSFSRQSHELVLKSGEFDPKFDVLRMLSRFFIEPLRPLHQMRMRVLHPVFSYVRNVQVV